ncbi:MAG TPA: pantoate--beta-alanine ligase [Acidobacteriota bacterium]|nr:pantoate--beta-alanine ligase [Acidobacteriota bacterium]
MKTARTIAPVRRQVAAWRRRGLTVGCVPTMGALHEGHLALIRRSVRQTDRTVVTIFVNPTQFGPRDDFAAYPRTWRTDAAACRREGVDLIFAPTVATMYPDGFETTVGVGDLGKIWEGAQRPGHFDGVATVVLKLFNIIQPDYAFFGQKDFQQALIIRRLAADFNLPVRIVTAPTVREPDGLALSSRNAYLGATGRADAAVIYRALAWAEKRIRAGAATPGPLVRRMGSDIERSGSFAVDYIGFCDPEKLRSQKRLSRPLVILIAATCKERGRAHGRRFIDNVLIR